MLLDWALRFMFVDYAASDVLTLLTEQIFEEG